MDIPAYLDGGLELEEVGLGEEHVLGGDAEAPDLRVRHLRVARRPPAAGLEEPPDQVVGRRLFHRLAGKGRENLAQPPPPRLASPQNPHPEPGTAKTLALS
uniref:Uncharacterized protein n=1 Tax=Arundo donax TaxID=35708 RepID=A0A0A9EJB0_ARUDO